MDAELQHKQGESINELLKEVATDPVPDPMLPPPGTDFAKLTAEELCAAVGALRARRATDAAADLVVKPILDRPILTPMQFKNKITTVKSIHWCKRAQDGFTPILTQPAMRLHQCYNTNISVPTKRTWTLLDPFSKTDVVQEEWTLQYPSKNLQKIARDITLSWQLYNTPELDDTTRMLLANTPITMDVDYISSGRYSDLWAYLRSKKRNLAIDTKWRVVGDRILS